MVDIFRFRIENLGTLYLHHDKVNTMVGVGKPVSCHCETLNVKVVQF